MSILAKSVFKTGPFAGVDVNDTFAAAAVQETPVVISLGKIQWPAGLDPQPRALGGYQPGKKITGAVTADADMLIVLYTEYETMALLDVFTGNNAWTPGRKSSWYPYSHNFDKFHDDIDGIDGDDALENGIFGYLYGMQVGGTKLVLYKSELHPKGNGPKLPFVSVIQQLVGELRPKLVVSTGTAGAIGANVNCGDVAVCRDARFHVENTYPDFSAINKMSNDEAELTSGGTTFGTGLTYARDKLLPLSVDGLRQCHGKLETRSGYAFVKQDVLPKVYTYDNAAPAPQPMVVVSADYLTVDDKNDTEGLQKLGIMNETDDAFAFYAISRLPSEQRPSWLSVRNASEPQIATTIPTGLTKQEIMDKIKSVAGAIYGIYQYCTTLNSAAVCWAIAADLTARPSK